MGTSQHDKDPTIESIRQTDGENEVESPSTSTPVTSSWKEFASQWNAVLTRQPKAAVATFLATQSTTWLALHTSFWVTGLVVPPTVAAGWAFARLTRRFRRPVNLFLAAGLYQIFPAVGDIKVTPLMGIVSDPKTDKQLTERRAQLEESVPWTRPVFHNITRGWEWLQGPVDTYGLALFLSGKASYLVTMGAATAAVSRGMDLEALLTSWGIGEALGEAAGTLAASTAANVMFVPVHFLAVVHGVPVMEEWAAKKDEEIRLYDLQLERERRTLDEGAEGGASARNHDNGQEEEGKEEHPHTSMDTLALGLLLWATAVGLYAIRSMGKAATKEKKDDQVGEANAARNVD